MSVNSESDECLSRAHLHVKNALREVNKVITQCAYGHDEYNEDAKARIRKWHATLLEMRDTMEMFR